MGKNLDRVNAAMYELENAIAVLVEEGDEDILVTASYDDLNDVLSGFYDNSAKNEWWLNNKDGDILNAEYQEYILDSAGIPDDEILSYKEWGLKRFHELHPLK